MKLDLFCLLQKEMILALGCTEPVALAYAGAVVKKHLGAEPEGMIIHCSPNIIKNVKSVIVPQTNGMKGIDVACITGACFGDAEKGLEVLSMMTKEQTALCASRAASIPCKIKVLKSKSALHFIVEGYYKNTHVSVEVKDEHTRIVRITRNNNIIFAEENDSPLQSSNDDVESYTVNDIIHFARHVDYEPLREQLSQSIDCNLEIAHEGLQKDYGINVGKTLLMTGDNNIRNLAKSYAAAASDARMSGCSLPVMINSGSGNQGITVSLPVIMYARHINATEDNLFRALILSNLIALYEKSFIGKLSAYCGVVCASSGAAAAITFLKGGNDYQIESAVINTLGTLSGIICDGAKPSCAAKIAGCVDTAFTCVEMALCHQRMSDGDGIVKNGLDKMALSVGNLACDGMRVTDQVILKIMLEQ
ncbi:serine dehydratase subunit alpha family protein [Cedecea colo]|nr:L-serine ammonia-lyase, iron-sulfur-dependent, subunit alpha [Cedecea colo]